MVPGPDDSLVDFKNLVNDALKFFQRSLHSSTTTNKMKCFHFSCVSLKVYYVPQINHDLKSKKVQFMLHFYSSDILKLDYD